MCVSDKLVLDVEALVPYHGNLSMELIMCLHDMVPGSRLVE